MRRAAEATVRNLVQRLAVAIHDATAREYARVVVMAAVAAET
jgi:hypothetical protein